MNKVYMFLGVLVIVNLSGCGTKGKIFTNFKQPHQGYGSLYIYRPDVFLTGALSYDIIDKKTNKVLGTLNNNSYFNKSLPEGKYVLKTVTNELEVEVIKNKIICIKSFVDIKHNPMYVRRNFTLNKVDTLKCQFEIKKTRKSI